MKTRVPDLSLISPDVPLRLEIAAQIAFPDGSITIKGCARKFHAELLDLNGLLVGSTQRWPTSNV